MNDRREARSNGPITRRRILAASALGGAAAVGGSALLGGPAASALQSEGENPRWQRGGSDRTTFVLVSGAWCGGFVWHAVARELEKQGYGVLAPTLPGMSAGDDPGKVSLSDAIRHLAFEVVRRDLRNVVLVAHDMAGSPVTAAAHLLKRRITSLVYFAGYVPVGGESFLDAIPADDREALTAAAEAAGGDRVLVPYPRWQNRFVQTRPEEVRQVTYGLLRPHPWSYFTESLSAREAAIPDLPRSYLVGSQDLSLPFGEEWWADKYAPRLGAEPIIFDAPHAAHLTDPVLLTDELIKAAQV